MAYHQSKVYTSCGQKCARTHQSKVYTSCGVQYCPDKSDVEY